MKKTNIFLGFVSTILVSGFIFNSANSFNPNLNNNSPYLENEIHVSNYLEFKNALEDTSQTTKNIIFDQDIDLSSGNISLNISSIYGNFITIDGHGHSIKNKPTNYYFTPVFDYFLISDSSETINTMTFKNLTLDNVGAFIGYINVSSVYDYDLIPDFKINDLIGKGLTFQNITIKNNVIKNQNLDLSDYKVGLEGGAQVFSNMYKNFGFLANNILLSASSSSELDQVVNFFNIHIENNVISNNTFNIIEQKQLDGTYSKTFSISESFLTNLELLSCEDSTHNHHSYISFQNIYINDNEIKDNTIKTGIFSNGYDFLQQDFMSSVYESFGNLSGNLNAVFNSGLKNYLYIKNIYISNNTIKESKKENVDGSLVTGNFKYAELISNPNNNYYNQNMTINSIENIFIFNNNVFYLDENYQYEQIKQNNIDLINIEIIQNSSNQTENILNSSNIKNLFIYGLYYDENEDFNLLKNVTSSTINIYYGKYLYEDTEEFYALVDLLNNLFGIYSYQINFDQIVEDDQTKNVFNSISKVSEEHIDIYYNNLIYSQDDPYMIKQYELKFKYYQPIKSENSNFINVVYDPYQITNLKLYNDQNEDQNLKDSEIIATSNQIYSIDQNNDYSVSLDLNKETKLTENLINNFDLNNLYLGFDYSNNSNFKESSSTILKINPDQLIKTFPNSPLNPAKEGNSKAFIIIMSSTAALILILILLVLLITLIIFKIKKSLNKNQNNSSSNNNLNKKESINSNKTINQNLNKKYSYNSQNQSKKNDFQNQDYNYEQNHDYNYQPNQDYNYEQNHDYNYQPNQDYNYEQNQDYNYEQNQDYNYEQNQDYNYEQNQDYNYEQNQDYENEYNKYYDSNEDDFDEHNKGISLLE